jgi:hypothetical protein
MHVRERERKRERGRGERGGRSKVSKVKVAP